MSKLKEIKLSSKQVYDGTLLNAWRDEVRLPNGRTSAREYIKHPGAVVILPVLSNGQIVFVRQFRYPMGMEFIELPAGKLDPGETPIDTGNARRSWYKKAWRSGESKAVIVNDAPYIEPLDNGHSKQQPRPGWIMRTVERIEQQWANRRTP